jgi:hypothetical protein
MPRDQAVYDISREARLVSVKFGKRVSIHDIADYAGALREDSRFDPGFSEIIDLSEVEQFQIEAKEAMVLADQIDPFSLNALRAFVAQTASQIHTARMHQLLRGAQKNIAIFAGFEEAREWVNEVRLADVHPPVRCW